MIILQKEHFDEEVINAAFQKISENASKELKIHFVYAGDYYWNNDKLRPIILNGMKKFKIKSVMLTCINMGKGELLTKEEMERYWKGENKILKESVNDDLESFFENLRLGKEPDEKVETYFLPQLTDEEMELVKTRDKNFYDNFVLKPNPAIHAEKIYFEAFSERRTFVIENSSRILSETSSEASSETSSETSFETYCETSSENSSEKQSCLKKCCNCSLQ